MKILRLTFCLMFLALGWASAQTPMEGKRVMSLGTNNSFSIQVDSLNAKEVEKLWMDFLKSNNIRKPEKDRKTGEIFGDNASLPSLSANTIDVYATVNERGAGAEVAVWFDLGGAYLSSYDHADKIPALQSWLDGFLRNTRIRKVEIELEGQETVLKDLNKEFAKLQKEQENLEKTILDAEKKIQEAKKDLELNASSQKTRTMEIENQQKMVERVKEKLKRIN
ncbi:MAG: hypothetical protein IPN74_11915 [Haliscomenobacter sp.]|nr:hypothetical protein [Haliscomenobacter sp.]MBK8879218.1 hypothetical protein [Haliscomenobacter sp.]